MFRVFSSRPSHYALLISVGAALNFINLGAPSLWDVDEGHNAEAAREMLESGSWVVPTFNYQLRVDKPALLYWLQIASYQTFGINEFAARLPSAVAALAAVLLAYELGRKMFDAPTGLLGGIVFASTVMSCASAHFANPDALLNLFAILTIYIFWLGFTLGSRRWFVFAGISTGCAVLAKGPVGLVLPAAVIATFLVFNRRWRTLWDSRLALGLLAFLLVALPWYAWVGEATHMDFWRGFFLTHNLGRFRAAMEGHHGTILYYPIWLLLGFVPWSVFLGPTIWLAVRDCRLIHRNQRDQPSDAQSNPGAPDPKLACRLLCCWLVIYLLFFAMAATKLPNYILPVYAPLAMLMSHFLVRWWRGSLALPSWIINTCLGCLVLVGGALSAGLLIAGGTVSLPMLQVRSLPGLEQGALLGIFPVLGALAAWGCLYLKRRSSAVAGVAAAAVMLVAALAAWGAIAVDRYKAPRSLCRAYQSQLPEQDVRIGCYRYYEPSLVFYAGREVFRFTESEDAQQFLEYPLPVYLFVPVSVWKSMANAPASPHRIIATHWDLYQNCEVAVVTNR
jgi:4-amino-4-deoxy-L-arabinose transferase-like glycosyltransferase